MLNGVNENRNILALEGHTKKVRNIKFHPSGNFIASASDDASCMVWDIDQHPQALAFKQAIIEGDEAAKVAYEDWQIDTY